MLITLLFFDSFFHLTQFWPNGLICEGDILAIVLGQFELITQKHDNVSACIGFGKGKDYIVCDINETFINAGTQVTTSLPFFMPSQELIPPPNFIEKST